MKAIVLHEYGGPEKLKFEDFPDPVPGEGEVLVRLAATSVNPVDYKMRSGEAKERFPVQFPGIIGRDVAGVVRSLGPKVDGMGFAPGDKVIAFASATYAELVVVKATDLAHLPEGLDLVEAAALPLVTLTGEQLISRGAKVQRGQTILVTGAVGGVGRTAVFVAKKAGATVIAGVRKSQLKEAGSLGADQVIALDDEAAMDKLGFLDAVADTVNHETAEKLIGKVKQGGTFASVLGPPPNAKLHPTVHVESVRAVPDAAMLRTLAEDVLAGRFKIPIDRMLPLEKAAEAHAAAEKGGIGKVLLLA
jgi:NADPH:quinone reductase-like Zn-dependent oxidoreductase